MDALNMVPLPFDYSRAIEVHSFLHEYLNVKFTKDFGIFKEGESYDSADIHLERGELKVYNGKVPIGMQEISLGLLAITQK